VLRPSQSEEYPSEHRAVFGHILLVLNCPAVSLSLSKKRFALDIFFHFFCEMAAGDPASLFVEKTSNCVKPLLQPRSHGEGDHDVRLDARRTCSSQIAVCSGHRD